jgi:uncharacterized surface protein with fasciclin (FAS1) repeats
MMLRSRSAISALFAVASVSVLALSGCGSDTVSTATTSGEAVGETTTSAVAATIDSTSVATTSEAPSSSDATTTTAAALGSIVDVATADGRFNVLLSAVEAAGLTETLATGKFTLLAPTDDAFGAFGMASVEAMLEDADTTQLVAFVKNHLLPVPQDARTITIFSNVVTVAGGSLAVTSDTGQVTIGGATVVAADVMADNGIIHVVDAVLAPAAA